MCLDIPFQDCSWQVLRTEDQLSDDLTAEEAELIRFLYSGMSKKYHNQQKQVQTPTICLVISKLYEIWIISKLLKSWTVQTSEMLHAREPASSA